MRLGQSVLPVVVDPHAHDCDRLRQGEPGEDHHRLCGRFGEPGVGVLGSWGRVEVAAVQNLGGGGDHGEQWGHVHCLAIYLNRNPRADAHRQLGRHANAGTDAHQQIHRIGRHPWLLLDLDPGPKAQAQIHRFVVGAHQHRRVDTAAPGRRLTGRQRGEQGGQVRRLRVEALGDADGVGGPGVRVRGDRDRGRQGAATGRHGEPGGSASGDINRPPEQRISGGHAAIRANGVGGAVQPISAGAAAQADEHQPKGSRWHLFGQELQAEAVAVPQPQAVFDAGVGQGLLRGITGSEHPRTAGPVEAVVWHVRRRQLHSRERGRGTHLPGHAGHLLQLRRFAVRIGQAGGLRGPALQPVLALGADRFAGAVFDQVDGLGEQVRQGQAGITHPADRFPAVRCADIRNPVAINGPADANGLIFVKPSLPG